MNRMFLIFATTCIALVAAYDRAAIAEIFFDKSSQKTNIDFNRNLQDIGNSSKFNHLLYLKKSFFLPHLDSGEVNPNNLNQTDNLLAREPQRKNPPAIHITKPRQPQQNVSEQQQTTRINLDSPNIRQAHNLVISSDSDIHLTAQITVDGRVVKTIKGRGGTVNLSRFLSRGRHNIQISGSYTPASSSVKVEFSGSGTTVDQAVGGSGIVRQIFIIDVE
ncbi:hypothetical protein [Argonema antarcticum]|uniref:hypothetical protein n=1 Tax=Argonema antarcticum TaxID=2942763 RepID=UPI002012D29F|nr:hypothetical protein [Argonema antarcticum]MCL1474256.1 hypothetical protein [Argonema antarcticum A004/B2]